MIWGDWISDRIALVQQKIIPEWNPYYVFGENYIGRDPFNNPLSLGNIFKFFFNDPSKEWVFALFFYLVVLGLGCFYFFKKQGISKKFSLLGAILIILFPKSFDDFYHGAGKFITGYSMIPWMLIVIQNIFKERKTNLHNFILLGVLSSIAFLGSGAVVCILIIYLIVPFYFYNIFVYFYKKNTSQNLFKNKDFYKIISFSLVSIIVALGLSSYLLFPLLENISSIERSRYGISSGYGFVDFLGMILPWDTRLYLDGVYNMPYSIPKLGCFNNIRSYFGVLLIPLLFYAFKVDQIRKKYFFFILWPCILYFLFSSIGYKVLPFISMTEKWLQAQSSESFMFFNFIFCFSLIIVAGLDHISKTMPNLNSPLKQSKKIASVLLIFYLVLLLAYMMSQFFILNFSWDFLLNKIPFNSTISIKIIIYAFFYSYLSYIIYAYLIIKILILFFFRKDNFFNKNYKVATLSILLILDFLIFPLFCYPFNNAHNIRYSADLEQNAFIQNNVSKVERVAANFYGLIPISWRNNLIENLKAKQLQNNKSLTPTDVYRETKDLITSSNLGYVDKLFDIGSSSYPVTVAKSVYNYHVSYFPKYMYDYDYHLNKNNPSYWRNSWMGIYDPNSPLLDIASIKYLFWYEKLNNPKYKFIKQFTVGGSYLYENTKALPRAYMVSNVELMESRNKLFQRLENKDFNYKTTALTEDKELIDQLVYLSKSHKKASVLDVSIENFSYNNITIKTNTDGYALVGITDLYHPYWNVIIDDKISKIFRINAAFRGIPVDSGIHIIKLSYRNKAFYLGLNITVIFVILLLGYVMFYCYKHRDRNIKYHLRNN
ncbi:MAG: YfhO family protein [Oligoflexia bacterium]|nr:YfhO family protein [Oligoflexia bacterium]